MRFPSQLQTSLEWFANFLDPWLPRTAYAVGGGTVLAARWHHRLSTDIDVFIDENDMSSLLDEAAWEEICEGLGKLVTDEVITGLFIRPNGFRFTYMNVPMSLFSVRRITRSAVTNERVAPTELATESNTEILFKKIRGRMINSSTYVARDLYDVVVAYVLDKESLKHAFRYLENLETRSLVYDVEKGDSEVSDLDRVIDPAYVELTASLNRFNKIAGEILTQNVSDSSERFLRDTVES